MSRLLVVGNACLDLVLRLDRLPAAGETRLASDLRREPGGKGLNQAATARRAGAEARFVAAIGNDEAGQLLREVVAVEGFARSDLVTLDGASDLSVVLVDAAGENLIASTATAAQALEPPAALADLRAGDILLVQGNLSASTTWASIEAAKARGARTLANLAPAAFDWRPQLPTVDLAVANAVELDVLGGAEALLAAGAGGVVATRGAAGAVLITPCRADAVPASPAEAVDTAGAGDVLCGVLAAGLALGMATGTALAWGVAAAALAVTRCGTFGGLPNAAELARLRPR